MAPERFRSGQVDPSSDTYALTCVLYQCLTGELPFPGSTFEQIALAHLMDPPPKPSVRARGQLSAAMDEVIATGMAKEPESRYSTPKHLAAAARLALATKSQPGAPNAGTSTPPIDFPTVAAPSVSVSYVPTPKADASNKVKSASGVVGFGDRAVAPKLSWRWGRWLYRPTQEIVDNDDPRVPKTVAEAKKQRRTWQLIEIQGYGAGGHYWRRMDMSTSWAAQPTFTATWHPDNGPPVELARASDHDAYYACVRHHQANWSD